MERAFTADLVIVGAGLVGLATAVSLLERKPGLRLVVLDKEPELATHQSGHNSGVLHAGLYYAPGSLKARLCREGRAALIAFADEHGIRYRLCGKLVVAVDDSELGAGPNAVPALAREGYGRLSVRPRDVLEVIGFPGFWKLARSYAGTGSAEIWRDLVKSAAVRQMQRYLPRLTSRD